jgi:exonuclease III
MVNPVNDLLQLDGELDAFEPDNFSQSKYYVQDEFLKLANEKFDSGNFTLLNVNSRSLIKNFSDYELFFQSLQSDNFHGFDILTFTETWLDGNLQQLVYFEHYNAIFKHKVGRKEGGGIAIFVKENMNYINRPDLSFPENKQHLFDSLFIEISSPYHTKNIILGVVYRSPSQNSIADFTLSITELLDNISHENKEVIVMGDTNVD